METTRIPLPPLPKTGFLYLFVLFVMAIGFYVLLLVSLAAYIGAFYLLVISTPEIIKSAGFGALRVVLPMLAGLYLALFVFTVAIFRGIFARSSGVVAGIHAHRAYHQTIFTLIREVAEKVGSRPLDKIIITPDANVAVSEETALYLPPGFGKRRVIIGMAALSFLTMDQLQAVLAHEFGHFSRHDTFFVRFIYRVHMGYAEVVSAMSDVRFFWLNPFYWIFSIYTWVYALIAASFDRLQEYRADRFAVEAYGRDLVAQALVKVHMEGSFFDEVGISELLDGIRSRRRYDNIYHHVGVLRRDYERQNPGYQRKILGQIITAKTHAMSTHPSLGERLRKQNVATALIQIPPLTRLHSTSGLYESIPEDLRVATTQGPPCAAEQLFGNDAFKLQNDLSYMAADHLARLVQIARAHRAAALEA